MKKKEKIYLTLTFAVLAAVGLVVGVWFSKGNTQDTPQKLVSESVQVKQPSGVITIEQAITVDVLQDGLQDMGKLITEEYYFTDILSFSSVKKLFNTIDLPFTASEFVVSYDGVVSAGLDFTRITAEKDEGNKIVTVRIPDVEIMAVDIDPESFVSHSEKTGLGNPISVSDYNASLVELENNARQKALERGILERARSNAERVIVHFADSLLGEGTYDLCFAEK